MALSRDELEASLETTRGLLDTIVDNRVATSSVPGVAAAVFHKGQIVYFRSAGQRALGAEAPDDATAFRVASCTKSFTALATLILRDRGLLSLDDPISKYMPMYTQVGPLAHCDAPTLRMLLAMSAGFGTDDPWADREESITPEQLEQHAANGVFLISIPGARYEYSNLGYAFLGRVIELVSKQSFPEFVTQEIFDPLALNDSSFSVESSRASAIAVGYRRRDDEWLAQDFSGPGSFSSIGGVITSVRDLAKWANWLASALDPATAESGPLSLSSRREMQQMHIPMPFSSGAATTPETENRLFGYGYALHVDIDEALGKFVSHSGGYPGYSAHMRWHERSGVGVIVLENARYSGAWATGTNLLETVLAPIALPKPVADTSVVEELVRATASLIEHWDDQKADVLCAPNVAMDIPYMERASAIDAMIQKIGGLTQQSEYELEIGESPLFARFLMKGETGSLNCAIRLTPVEPLLIQTLNVSIL